MLILPDESSKGALTRYFEQLSEVERERLLGEQRGSRLESSRQINTHVKEESDHDIDKVDSTEHHNK